MNDQSPATLRNREPIAAILEQVLPPRGLVLEIASGGGEHAAYFAARFAALEWQPSDRDRRSIATMQARFAELELPNLRQPLSLDAAFEQWSIRTADAVICTNMVHISPWSASEGLFEGAARLLEPGAPLVIYGPFIEDGIETAASNLAFDQNLRDRDPRWGVRHREALGKLASRTGFALDRRVEMPANNLTLVYRRRA